MRAFLERRSVHGRADEPRVHVVLFERGTGAREHVPSPDPTAEIALLVQALDETAAEFTVSALRRMSVIESSGRRAVTATISVERESTAECFACRRAIAGAVIQHFMAHGSGELVFSAPPEASHALRHGLLELTESLIAELAGQRISIRVRFGAAPEQRPARRTRRAVSRGEQRAVPSRRVAAA